MNIPTAPYLEQVAGWPVAGRHILASFDERTVVVYQAYRPAIADFAVANQRLGGEFSWSRMSWIKPNFLWMMYRSGWATKEGQERVLAITIGRAFLDGVLRGAVHSTFIPDLHGDEERWKRMLDGSTVRLQWDPDHDPAGNPVTRRAVQLGLRGETLRRFGTEQVIGIEDITPFVEQQRKHASSRHPTELLTPVERPYPVDAAMAGAILSTVEHAP